MLIKNKKGQFESKLLAVIMIFIIAIVLIFFNKVNVELYESFDSYFNESDKYNDSLAQDANLKILTIERSVWDYAFLAIFIGLIIQIILFSFATRISLAFYWLMVLLDLPILIVGVILSNIWQEMAINPEFVETIARFPITDLILGSYFPVGIVFIIFITSIILFGKRPEEVIF